jgi:O-methyltransferase involved in polyketide biosynthesis
MPEFNPSVPSIARVYDYFLGGKDHFASDRALADRMIEMAPLAPVITRENRQFIVRAVTWAASQGIGQFLDLGCGMPTAPDTLESARGVIAGARVAYVDNDPVVLSHLSARVAKGAPGVTVVAGDVREVPVILDAVQAGIDFSAPVCLIMGFLLHFFTADAARDLVARYTAALPSGSLLVLSAIHVDTKGADEGFAGYSTAVAPVYNHSAAEFASFFDSLEILPPGVVDARMWCAQTGAPDPLERDQYAIVGVARI